MIQLPQTHRLAGPGEAELMARLAGSATGAELDAAQERRYLLWRVLDASLPLLGVVMLNPSTACASTDDPTIRKCLGFAQRLGFGGIVVANVYSWRATDPRDLWKAADPVGPEADDYIGLVARGAGVVLCAWGAHAEPARVRAVTEILRATEASLVHLGLTKNGMPKHPLMVPYREGLRPL